MTEEITTVKRVLEEFLGRIKGTTCYRDKITIYAPTCRGKCVDVVNELEKDINRIFGGSTSWEGRGCWYNPEIQDVECEPVRVIEAAHNCITEKQARQLAQALMDYARDAQQYALAVSENGAFYIAETKKMMKRLLEMLLQKEI